tara:strand:+ start:10387 stop:13635 length:3249 start_codon:yes stop_codon:yes gene_type:complete
MANSFVRYTGDGNTTAYSIPFSYRVAGDITVTINGVATTAFTYNAAGTTLTFNSAPANLSSIEIRRTTSQASRLTDYSSGSVLTESDLDTDSTQAFFMGQEAIDDAGDKIKIDNTDFQWDAQSKRLKNVAAPTADTDAATRGFISTNIPNITTVAGIESDVTTVAGISANVTTVAGNNANVTTVAGNIANVNTVATNISDVVTVANDLNEAISEIETAANDLNEATSEIDTVATNITNVDTVGTNIANVNTVAGISANVTTVAGISANVTSVAGNETNINAVNSNSSNINTVAGVSSNVTTVANNNANVTTVAGISGNVTTVAGISADVTAVAADATDIGAVAAKATEIGLLGTADAVADMAILGTADVVADMNTLGTADVVADMNTLGTADVVTDMNTLGTADVVNDMNVLGTSGNVTNMNTLAGISSDITTVSGIAANTTTVAGVAANVTTVAGISSDVTTAAGNNANITTVAGANSNISTVAGAIANVNTVASNVAGVNSFAERYRVDSSDPSSSLDAGDLAFNTSANALKYYDGSAWQQIVAGSLTSIVQDGSPQLGGDLDLNSNDITGTGNINITGGVTMSGNLTVNGTTTTINSTTLTVDDKNMVLASGAADSSAADGSGITIDGASAELKYVHSGTKWTVNKDFDVTGNIIVSGTVDGIDIATRDAVLTSTTTTAGAALPKAGGTMTGNITFNAGQATGNSGLVPAAGTSGHFLAHDGAFAQVAYSDLSGTPTIPAAVGGASGVHFNDNVKITAGDSGTPDLEIYHDGTNSIIADTNNGDLKIRGGTEIAIEKSDGTSMAKFQNDGYVKLYHSGSEKLSTTASGIYLGDNVKATFGDATTPDLEIYHDGTDNNTYIDENGSGSLILRGNDLLLKKYTGETYVHCVVDGAVTLYHDNSAKLATGSGGVDITGTATATTFDGLLETGVALKTGAWYSDNAGNGTQSQRFYFYNNGTTILHSADAWLFQNNNATKFTIDSSGNATAVGNVTAYSDERLKSDVKTIDNALDKVSQMRGVTYTKDNEKGSGVIAQEIEKIAPELVMDGEYKSVAYGNTVGYLIEAIKELKAEIEELKGGK